MKACAWRSGVLCALLGLAGLLAPGEGWAADTYADGSRINLATLRGVVATSSQNSGGANPVHAPLHSGYTWEFRSGAYSGSGSIWWQMEMPAVYWVSNWTVVWFSAPYAVSNFTVQTSLDGSAWTVQAAVSNNTAAKVTGSFPAVQAKFVRLDATAFHSLAYGMILQKVRFTGPNNPEINESISVAQSTWNGGSASGTSWGDIGQAIDDGVLADWNFGCVYAASNPANPVIILLNGSYLVKRIGLTNFHVSDTRGARDIDVYASQLASGNSDWVLLKQLRDIPTDVGPVRMNYQEYEITPPAASVRRLRFDVIRNRGHASQTYINELYVYAIPPPRGAMMLMR